MDWNPCSRKRGSNADKWTVCACATVKRGETSAINPSVIFPWYCHRQRSASLPFLSLSLSLPVSLSLSPSLSPFSVLWASPLLLCQRKQKVVLKPLHTTGEWTRTAVLIELSGSLLTVSYLNEVDPSVQWVYLNYVDPFLQLCYLNEVDSSVQWVYLN